MPGEASTHKAQQERQRHPHQHEVSARGPRQATEAKPPPRAHIVDTSGNLASGTAARDPSQVGKSLVAELAVIVTPKRFLPGAKRCKPALASKYYRRSRTHNANTPRGPPRRALGTCVVRQTSRRPKHHANVPNIVPRNTEERRYNKTQNFKRPT